MNCVLRAQLQSGKTLVFKQSLPYVAKYPDIPAPLERLDVEANFYRTVSREPALASHMPNIKGYDQSEHILCMQDLGAARDFSYLYEQSGADEQSSLTALVNWLQRLHHLSIPTEHIAQFANASMRELNHAHIFVIPLLADNGVTLSEPVAQSAAELRRDQSLRDAAKYLGDIYLGVVAHASQPCLLHGDYYPGSWLWQAEGQPSMMVIDPEFGFYGAPEFDLGVMYAHLLFAGYERASIDTLFAHYERPTDFSDELALQFAGMEVIRRLLGVAQLPLAADDTIKQNWLSMARDMVVV